MQKRQDVLIAINLVELDVKASKQIQNMIFVEAHFLKCPEFKFDALLVQ